jgi:hypothetical protein
MESARESFDRGQARAEVTYSLPDGSAGMWTLVVPSALAICVGTYARIPEFSRFGPFLHTAPSAS